MATTMDDKSNIVTQRNITSESPSEASSPVLVQYIWNMKKKKTSADPNKPIIDAIKECENYEDSRYLFIVSRKHEAIINPWVLCGALEKGEELEVSLKKIKSSETSSYDSYTDGVFFKVSHLGKTSGGATRNVLGEAKYPDGSSLAVFGYNHWTVKEALQNDKRFNITNEFSLEHPDEGELVSNITLSDLKPHTYSILLHSDVTTSRLNKNKVLETKVSHEIGESSSNPTTNSAISPCNSLEPYEKCAALQSEASTKFSNDFNKLGRRQIEDCWSDSIEDYKRNVLYKDPITARTHEILNGHMSNVGFIKCQYGKELETGTFFLLTETLGLTCFHVMEKYLLSNATKNVHILFNYHDEPEKRDLYPATFIEVVSSSKDCDYSLLRITMSPYPKRPKGLLEHVAFPPREGALSIIGHPGGKCKKVDSMCSVIEFSKRAEVIVGTVLSDRSYIHVLTKYSFQQLADPSLVVYDSCLYHGASGGPVFNNQGQLVAMHTGGYIADTHLKKKSIIEYGSSIVHIIICEAITVPELGSKFKEIISKDESLYWDIQPGGPREMMQPFIREFLRLYEVTPQWPRNPKMNDSGIVDESMDTSQ